MRYDVRDLQGVVPSSCTAALVTADNFEQTVKFIRRPAYGRYNTEADSRIAAVGNSEKLRQHRPVGWKLSEFETGSLRLETLRATFAENEKCSET